MSNESTLSSPACMLPRIIASDDPGQQGEYRPMSDWFASQYVRPASVRWLEDSNQRCVRDVQSIHPGGVERVQSLTSGLELLRQRLLRGLDLAEARVGVG